MAGMLPGVESARRRRFHKSATSLDSPPLSSIRRSSFCLYASNHESSCLSSSSSSLQIRGLRLDESLGGVAREAKQRLDDKFRAQRISETKGENSDGLKKSGSRRFNWSKLISWKASEQEDCAVCLETFRIGETLISLPCAHRFHSRCLKPWLENNSHCPCCRTTILSL